MMKKIITLALTAAFVSGCATQPTEKTSYRTKVLDIPEDFLKPCDLQAPPDIESYMAMELSDREKEMVKAYNGATAKTIVCNVRLNKLKQYIEKQKQDLQSKSD